MPRSPQAITVLDISDKGDIGVWALAGKAFRDRIDIRDLPASLNSAQKRIERLDKAALPSVHWQSDPKN